MENAKSSASLILAIVSALACVRTQNASLFLIFASRSGRNNPQHTARTNEKSILPPSYSDIPFPCGMPAEARTGYRIPV